MSAAAADAAPAKRPRARPAYKTLRRSLKNDPLPNLNLSATILPILLVTAYLIWNNLHTVETGFPSSLPAELKAFVYCPNQDLGRELVHALLNSTSLHVTDFNNPETFNLTSAGLPPSLVRARLRAEGFNASELLGGHASQMLKYRLRNQGLGFVCATRFESLAVLQAARIGRTRHLSLIGGGCPAAGDLAGLEARRD